MNNNKRPDVFPNTDSYYNESPSLMEKIKSNPMLTVATVGFTGIAGYRIFQARNRGGTKLSFFLIHTRLAAQGFAVAALGSVVLYSLFNRLYYGSPLMESPNSRSEKQ